MHFNYKEIAASETEYLKIYGRTVYDKGLCISWSNSGVELNFKGNRLEFHFEDYQSEQPVYVKAYTEKGEQRFGLHGIMPKVILEFDADKKHTVKLLRISEGDALLVLRSIKAFGKNPEFLNPPLEKKLKLEFLGDSITAGFGVVSSADQDAYYTYEQDSTVAYAYLTGQLLDAEIRTEAISGQGMYRNCNGEVGVQFKRIFDMAVRTQDGYDHSQWMPDVMILNCGTNDVSGGTDEATMYREADFLLNKVRSAYPKTKIIWTYGLMNDKYHNTFKRLVSSKNIGGDKNIYYLPLALISAKKNEIGAIGHPNVNASERAAKKLAKFIQSIV